LYNGQWIEPDTYQVVVGYGIAQNSQWDYWISITGSLVPKRKKITNPQSF
jgi:hypothetical protein